MTSNYTQIKVGLLGNTGVGKTTFVSILKEILPNKQILNLKLSAPLYEAQAAIYKICQVEKDYHSQDGELLNFFGRHMRKINPNVLQDNFRQQLESTSSNIDIITCDDIRPLDVNFMRAEGFSIIYIDTNNEIARERRASRGDLTLADSSHSTESGISEGMYDFRIQNSGSLQEYKKEIIELLKLSLNIAINV